MSEDTERITRESLEDALRDLQADVDRETQPLLVKVAYGAAVAAIVLIGLAYVFGRRAGRRRATVGGSKADLSGGPPGAELGGRLDHPPGGSPGPARQLEDLVRGACGYRLGQGAAKGDAAQRALDGAVAAARARRWNRGPAPEGEARLSPGEATLLRCESCCATRPGRWRWRVR